MFQCVSNYALKTTIQAQLKYNNHFILHYFLSQLFIIFQVNCCQMCCQKRCQYKLHFTLLVQANYTPLCVQFQYFKGLAIGLAIHLIFFVYPPYAIACQIEAFIVGVYAAHSLAQ